MLKSQIVFRDATEGRNIGMPMPTELAKLRIEKLRGSPLYRRGTLSMGTKGGTRGYCRRQM